MLTGIPNILSGESLPIGIMDYTNASRTLILSCKRERERERERGGRERERDAPPAVEDKPAIV